MSETTMNLTAARHAVDVVNRLDDDDLQALRSRLYQVTFEGLRPSVERAMMSLLLMVGSVAVRRQRAHEQQVADTGDGHFARVVQGPGPGAPALAYCSPCNWCGPLRSTTVEAETDSRQHRAGETVEDEEWIGETLS